MSRDKRFARAVQAAIKADPSKEIASYQWCQQQVVKYRYVAMADVDTAIGDRRVSRDEYTGFVELRLTALILPEARPAAPKGT